MMSSLLFAIAYAALGVALLVVGFVAFDLLTPGRLGAKIYVDRSLNAALIVGAMFVGLGAIAGVAIYTNGASHFGEAFMWTLGFGLLGVLLQVLSFVVLDVITPGSLREIAVDARFHPGALVAAAAQLAISLVICASIS